MVTENTEVVWLELRGRSYRVDPEQFEYLVKDTLPRDRTWPISSPETDRAREQAIAGGYSSGWWLARFSGILEPVCDVFVTRIPGALVKKPRP